MEPIRPDQTYRDGKTVAVIGYITIIGWLIAFFGMHKDRKTAFGSYHLRQALYLFIAVFVVSLAIRILFAITGMLFLLTLSNIVSIAYLVYMIIGIVNASRGEEKPLPGIGQGAESMFQDI